MVSEIDVSEHNIDYTNRSQLLKPLQHPRAGKIKLVSPAVTYSGKRMPITRPPPYLSQHTTEVGWAFSHGAS